MAPLVAYDSSDEDEDVQQPEASAIQTNKDESTLPKTNNISVTAAEPSLPSHPAPGSQTQPSPAPAPGPQLPPLSEVPLGPSIGPSLPPIDTTEVPEVEDGPPLSPYTAERNLLRDLTLPTVPNMDLPPSPPGSPAPGLEERFQHFLAIKKQGQHFNARLATSSAARNPSLTDKLLSFSGISSTGESEKDDLRAQYQTSLPTDLWNPTGFPDWAFRTELKKTREKLVKEREAERASGIRGVEFVPATTTSGGASSGSGSKRKSRFDQQ